MGDVDDVANQVFHGAFARIGSFEGSAPAFRSWLFTIAWNKSCDWHRRHARERALRGGSGPVPDIEGGDVEHEALAVLGSGTVEALLGVLTPDQRDVILLRMVGELSLEETAAVIGKPIGATKALQHRGLAALRRFLDEAVPPEAESAITGLR